MRPSLLVWLVAAGLSRAAFAFEPFVVKDIRVEGIQRTEAGTVFSYLPVKVGETFDEEKSAAAIKALYATGFFSDVRLEVQDGVLIVQVQERPAIGQIDIFGAKEFSKDQLKTGLKEVGLAESRIFDRALLDKAEQELKRQYLARGKYGVEIKTTVTPLERNRVAIRFDISEGEVAKIRQINIVGAQAFREKDLLELMNLSTPNWLSWYTKNDQYSKQKLAGDLETLRSFYLNRGYMDFAIESTQVQITPDKKDIYITINIHEGPRYTLSDIKVAGELLIPEDELRKLVKVKSGEVFSRERITETTKAISDRLGNEGYAFANVNAVPEVDRERQRVAFTFFIDPGRRVYVRQVRISGNTRTRDEVIRREMRQIEGGWYSAAKINRSKERIDKLDYFKEVNIETPAVPGTTDQVDVNVRVEEKPTGSIMAGAGFSSGEGLILSGSVSQANVLGSGNFLAVQANTSKVNTVYALSYTNPYYTDDGLSLGFDIYTRKVDSTALSVTTYTTSSQGLGLRLGVPIAETDSIGFGLGYEHTKSTVDTTASPVYAQFVSTFGNSYSILRGDASWARDTRDSRLYPMKGRLQRAVGEIGLPGAELNYVKLTYQHQWLTPLSRDTALLLNGEVGWAKGLLGDPFPFFKNYYAGGVTSVRGYKAGTIGPKDNLGQAIGGTRRIIGNAEYLFPLPGLKNDKSARLSAFLDAGAVYGPDAKVSLGDLRYSAGIALSWVSPVGPLKFSLAKALNPKPDDKTEVFQFQLGSVF
ncbi:outer membrane protein assembly factor BamA [Thiobacter aerophilum]|uniref:Outer membrane protein assembly factor BamA n=1 Tax=Thiobacter aerophilum TaxID=3121275 RepID=A0ABV0ECZ4_9BURK